MARIRLPGGELEYAILAALWALGRASARDVHARAGEPAGLAYTTTATVLDRLHAKGLVAREKVARAFVYRPRVGRQLVEGARLKQTLNWLIGSRPMPAMRASWTRSSSSVPSGSTIWPRRSRSAGGSIVRPEVVLVLLVFLTAAPAAMLAGCLHNSRPVTFASPLELERACWREVWIPFLPRAVACVMGGWAIAEPVPADEPVTPLAVLIASPFAFVWCRALVRAVGSWLLPSAEDPLAATVGLFRPTVVLSPVLRGALDLDAFAAVRACLKGRHGTQVRGV